MKKTKNKKAQKDGEEKSEKSSFFAWDGETLVLRILGKPNARKDTIGKVQGKQLQVSVTAAPVAGKATDHMVRFLAGEFGVPVADVEVVSGRMNVNKQLRVKAPKKWPPGLADLCKIK